MIAVIAENCSSTKVSWEGNGTHHHMSGSETVAPIKHSTDGAMFNTAVGHGLLLMAQCVHCVQT